MSKNAAHPRHAAPERRRVSHAHLLWALIGGALSWGFALIIAYASGNYACHPLPTARAFNWPGAIVHWLTLVYALALVISLFACWKGLQIWRATRAEHFGGAAPAADIGEGRTRFLAMWTIGFNAVFALTNLFHLLSLAAGPSCA